MDFSTFKNKYILTGKIVVLNALHIGSGKETDDRDALKYPLKVDPGI